MTDTNHAKNRTRSLDLLSRDDSRLVLVDVQEKLVPAIHDSSAVVANCKDLLTAAAIFEVPIAATEQYPRGLGNTVAELIDAVPVCGEKVRFSAVDALPFDELRDKVVICGIEAHVCVMQTAFDLLAAGQRVYLPVDAVGSRFSLDRDTAIARLRDHGATVTTTETIIFEWCETAADPQFKTISKLIQERSKRIADS